MLLDDLNKEQRLVAENTEGPMLVLAGAGSGKTRAITYRIANLIKNGVLPYNILALTFTNKAAKEMRERIDTLVSTRSSDIWVSTFHSFAARVLRRDIDKLGFEKSFTIYDDDDQLSLIKSIIKDKEIDDKIYVPKNIKAIISDSKNHLIDADTWFSQSEKDFKSEKIHEIFYTYDERLKKSNALDFNDLLVKTIMLFTEHKDVLDYYINKFKYVHVDEYQDTNYAQYSIVKFITGKNHNLCVVGDDDQSIYGWRGADIRNILDFEKDYKNAKVIKLERNYRSSQNILDAANKVISNNEGRKEKNLWTEQESGELISIFSAGDEREEAAWICDRIHQLNDNSSKAIIYRTNAQSRVIEDMLMRAGIAYRIFGSKKFYDRKEVRDLLAYLRVVANPSDDVSLKRIINQPKRSIGNSTIDELVATANKNDLPLFAALYDLPDTLSSRPKKCVSVFAELLLELIDASKTMPLTSFVDFLVNKTGLLAQYENDLSDEAKSRIENTNELIGAITEFEANTEDATLQSYLENVSLFTDLDNAEDDANFISLMTLHSVKGLEFDVVFIAGMEENIFPSFRSIHESDRLEEERRLCYVGITRARKKLFLSYANQRTLYNQASFNKPSRFLDEIPTELLDSGNIDDMESSFPETKNDTKSSISHRLSKQKQARNLNFGVPDIIQPKEIKALKNLPFAQKGFSPSIADSLNTKSFMNIFKSGDRVLHKKFGEGDVVSTSGAGKDARIVISFSAYGEKEFSLSIAPIVKLNK